MRSPKGVPGPTSAPATSDVALLLPRLQGAAVDHLALGNEAAEKEEYSLALRHWEEGLREGSDAPHILHEQMSQVGFKLGGHRRSSEHICSSGFAG